MFWFLWISLVTGQECSVCCSTLVERPTMTYTYYQNSGRFVGGTGDYAIETVGYAGNNTDTVQGRNNPEAQCVPNIGPAPANVYILAKCSDTMHKGTVITPCAFPMTPQDESLMCGRFAFWIHGCGSCDGTNCDYTEPPCGTCSQGCIVIPKTERVKLRTGDIVKVMNYDPNYS